MFQADKWWRGAAIYQVYVRSFADADGDGVGDLAGVRSQLPYLAELGIDALWFNPWYASPMADGGYDVADYRAIHPTFGTLAEAERLIAEALEHGIRTVVDIVPNHVSDQHRWFQEALAARPGSPERERFWFREGRGEHGERPPNNWTSQFGGSAWTRVPDGQWYLHRFAPGQPDLNWQHPEVRKEHEEVLRFWFDRGAAGVRIDSAAELVKDPELPDLVESTEPHPYLDRDEIHDVYRSWRKLADSYAQPRALIGEVWLADPGRFARYLRPDELHTAFNFGFLTCPWNAERLRDVIATTLAVHAPVGAPATWVLANHDITRTVTRYGRADTGFDFAAKAHGIPTDLGLGTRRARAAALLSLALPGSVYLYQGEELALPEIEDLPAEVIEDPMFHRTGGSDPGRDGCRVPLPWRGDTAPFGFSPVPVTTWLPQPADWGTLTVELQQRDPQSMLNLYRAALRLRRSEPALGDGQLAWLPSGSQALAFARSPRFACVVNLGTSPVCLPAHDRVLLSSGKLFDGRLPPDTAVWLRLA
ncbi:glycoside hydrolase family 13 protein [Streptomyces sp. RB6PN25]|uniref:Glycoside hydrolase family 13 protein n=1 Tax=Streptomyces humicola TaxID=2953240 RepID=A0ABT1PQ34_9ACTN|nr:glycoside hydrolase family 13 protein [Streptomyces humicola]MCQ4079238.1 glycoside hydrolase family 13 protein [Streptomyces humicola]